MSSDRWKVRFAYPVHDGAPTDTHGMPTRRQSHVASYSHWTDPVQVRIADSFMGRLRGLLASPALLDGHGLLITQCSSVHSMGMRYAIDVLFLDKHGQLLQWQTLQPWRVAYCRASAVALELPAGSADRLGVTSGSRLLGIDFAELQR